jgi:pSer/pThr/pTyr-binding forkhead associated (FHA) protein
MNDDVNGELVPLGGGDAIPLLRPVMSLGRRESCDVCLPFPDVSGIHCELTFRDGYWSVKDLNSTNGVKVNGMRVQSRPLKPGDEVSFGRKHRFTVQYSLSPEAQHELDTLLTEDENIFGKSLLEKAGLSSGGPPQPRRPLAPKPQQRPWPGQKIEPTELDE